eukprot:GHRQ01028211.1.p1 GENE.GHRQ01028211.1~~GHRQ01028211.1.p1  ORF type:complete len:150 (-),score=13.03 GHRQ01028211.1:254-703(-)
MLHFWLSRGRGTFGLVDTPCTSLYALLSTEVAYNTHIDRDNGWKAVASPVDPRSAYFTVLRSTSCIQSAVAQLEAYSRGADLVGCRRGSGFRRPCGWGHWYGWGCCGAAWSLCAAHAVGEGVCQVLSTCSRLVLLTCSGIVTGLHESHA